jgi:hypothetical protein
MTTPATPSSPTPAGDDRNLVAVDPAMAITFEDKVHLFWKKNHKAVYALCALILAGIVGRWAWGQMAESRELKVENAYAAATTPEQLKSFSDANAGHTLGGIAQLRIADEAYKAGKTADAATAYDKAATMLKDGPLAARAKLGRALAKVQAGKAPEGTDELKKLADDAGQNKAVRAEATYHLTSLAVEAGNAADAQKYVEQLGKIDQGSQWLSRAMSMRASMPATPAPAAPGAKTESAQPVLNLNLPGKK